MKRVLTVVLACMLVLGLFGCGAEEAAPVQTVPETTAPAETTVPPTEAETEPPITEPVFDLTTWQGSYDQGLYFMESKRWQEAYDAFDAAVALDPQQADGYARRGNARILMEENEENLSLSWEDYQQALTLDDTNARAYLGIVDVHIRRAEYDKADSAMENAVKKTDNDPLLSKMVSWLDQGKYLDSSYTYRYTRKRYYDNGGRYIGCITVKYEAGIQVLAESFNASGKSTGVLELSEIKEGNVTEEVSYWVETRESDVIVCKYIEWKTVHDDGTSELKSTMYKANGTPSSSGHTYYDADGNSIRHESYDSNGNMQFYSTSEYDSEGRVIRSCNYIEDGTLKEYTENIYDSDGRMIRSDFCRGNGELISYTITLYTENGRVKGQETYSPNGELLRAVIYD